MRFILFLLFPLQLLSQEVTVRSITITGNKKTKSYIVARELAVQKNQSYTLPEILDGLELSRQNLMNTTLFLETNICFTNWNNDSLDILVDVKERWYYIWLHAKNGTELLQSFF